MAYTVDMVYIVDMSTLLAWFTLFTWFALLTWFTLLTYLTLLTCGHVGDEALIEGDEGDETLLSSITYSDSVLFSCNCAKPSDVYPYQLDQQSSGHRLLEIFLCLRHEHLDFETLNLRETIVFLI